MSNWEEPDDEPHSADYDAGWNAAVKQAMPVIERLEAKVARLATTQGAVSLTDDQWDRVLWWLHKPVPPGQAKALDESIIREITAQREQ